MNRDPVTMGGVRARHGSHRWLLALPLLALSCAGSPRVSLYALEAPGAPPMEIVETGDASLTLGPIELPSYLDRRQIVTRSGPHELQSSEGHRWGEDLDRAVARVLLREVAARLPGTRVGAFGAEAMGQLRVTIRFHQLERDPRGTVHLVARWILEGGGPPGERTERWTRIEESASAGGHAESVAAMSRALARFADEIAATVREGHGA